MIKIYHHPKCSKSREGLAIVEASGKPFQIIKYMDEQLPVPTLERVIDALGIKPMELVRTNETIWKESYKGKTLSDNEIIKALATHPKLIQRPIVINGKKAIIGRPPSNIKSIL
ncbi:arsenate reductase (glutaredoxin) [Dokdonia ponticola]|uniref:Arsenate reductase (Glutaredoxin) n=1 Tax=Dokdonia ponticola TaxID=2041041 RepID=A0ABV9I005_9FLAO